MLMRKDIMSCFGFFLLSMQVMAQTRIVSGKISDTQGKAIPGASIVVKGTTNGTLSANDGSFTLSVPENATSLLVSNIGMGEKEISLTDASSYNIILTTVTKNDLQEVVVVGYGTQRRANVTASISTVKAAEIENKPFTSVDQMLQGKVAGLQAPLSTGQPGAAQPIRIRGIGSVSAGASPLYVVDGIIVNFGDLSRLSTTSNALSGLNQNDIESVNVLKDAQATSIYGSRGSNGVIVITTKKGRAGKTKYRADVEMGVNSLAPLPDNAHFLNAEEYLMLQEEGLINRGATQAQIDATLAALGKGSGVDTDWMDLVQRNGVQQQYNLSASGGDAKNQFYVSGGYFKQQAAVIPAEFKRYSLRTNYKHISSDKLNFNIILNASHSYQNTPLNGGLFASPISAVAWLRPTMNPYNADGSLNISTTGGSNFNNGAYNPLYIAKYDKNDLNRTLLQGNISAEYAILKGLRFTSRYGVDYNQMEEYNYYNQFHGDGPSQGGIGLAYYTRYFNWIATNQLDYNTFFGSDGLLRLDAKLGYEAQKSKNYNINARADGFPPNSDLYLSVNAATPKAGAASASDYDFAGLYSAITFNFDDKYILSGSFRRDGSSRFSDNTKYGNFWSVGGAWNINKEDFFAALSFVNSLKLRASYGKTGNASLGDYAWRQTYGFGFNYNGQPGGTFNVVGNENLTWESTNQADIGMDASFLNDRISIVVDVYRRVSDRLLFSQPLSRTTGFTSFTNNIGKLENKGIEFTLNATPLRTKDFSWDLSFNITHNKNKVLKLPDGKDIVDGAFILREGYDYRTFYVREWAGVDPANGDPLWYVDGSHEETTNNYNSAQRQLIGSASPKYFGGLTNSFSFKGFTLAADLVYNYGNRVRDSWIFYLADGAYPPFNKYRINLQRWQKPGDVTDVPKYVYGSTNSSSSFSTRFLNKGDFIKLRNVTISYDLNSSLISRIGLNSARFYVRGTNLLTKTYDNNLTIDPEQGINGASNQDIYYTRSVTAGLNIGF